MLIIETTAKMKHSKWKIILLPLFAVLTACSGNMVYNEYDDVDPEGWNMDSAVAFVYNASDTTGVYEIIVDVRHNKNYRYQNFWMFINSSSPQGYVRKDTIECYLADNRGRWLSDRTLSVYNMPVIYMPRIKFPVTGEYRFEVYHGLRDSLLRDVEGIGLCIKKIEDEQK